MDAAVRRGRPHRSGCAGELLEGVELYPGGWPLPMAEVAGALDGILLVLPVVASELILGNARPTQMGAM